MSLFSNAGTVRTCASCGSKKRRLLRRTRDDWRGQLVLVLQCRAPGCGVVREVRP